MEDIKCSHVLFQPCRQITHPNAQDSSSMIAPGSMHHLYQHPRASTHMHTHIHTHTHTQTHTHTHARTHTHAHTHTHTHAHTHAHMFNPAVGVLHTMTPIVSSSMRDPGSVHHHHPSRLCYADLRRIIASFNPRLLVHRTFSPQFQRQCRNAQNKKQARACVCV